MAKIGRPKGSPNKDKTELRAMVQERVAEFTARRRVEMRDELAEKHPEWGSDRIQAYIDKHQPQEDEYDPVVYLATMGVDSRLKPELRRQASAEAAQYLRPKLKSIEILDDEEGKELLAEKNLLAGKLVEMLGIVSAAKRDAGEDSEEDALRSILDEIDEETDDD